MRTDNRKVSILLVFSLAIVALTVMPLVVIFSSWKHSAQEIWQHMVETILADLFKNSALLCSGVAITTGILGTTLAWFTGVCDYPGRRFFSWALLLPLAIPTYVLAFVFLGLFDFVGPVQSLIRRAGLSWNIEIRSTLGVVIVMSLALYPYVYLLARGAFVSHGKSLLEAAQSLGCSNRSAFFRVALPMARPWIAGGVLLVIMETLADFGAVSIFNYDTFTTAIYKAWSGFFSIEVAAQISSILVMIVFVIILLEQQTRKNRHFAESVKHSTQVKRIRLQGATKWLAFSISSAVLLIAFVIPLIQIIIWCFREREWFDSSYIALVGHSLVLSLMAALFILICSMVLAYTQRRYPNTFISVITKTATLGYALPGTVLAVGLFIAITWFDKALVFLFGIAGLESSAFLQGTVVTMILAYAVRFMAAGFNPVNSALKQLSKSIDEAACSLKVTGVKMIARVHVPILKKGLFTATILVFIDVMKEMPITLMTRPFGWDTLAVKIYELTSEGEWQRAAIPAAILIAGGVIPVVFLTKQVDA
nr:iron ABC transporter permease [Desulfobulbaceae bacterium]